MFDDEDPMILGVCLYLSNKLEKPVNMIRWFFIISIFMGAPIGIYLAIWLLIEMEILK